MMLVKIHTPEISISNIEIGEIEFIKKWLTIEYEKLPKSDIVTELSGIEDRILECILSESEFFLKISKEDKVIGVLKGRIEFDDRNKLWILFFFLGEEYRKKGLGLKVLNLVTNNFKNKFSINEFYTLVEENEKGVYEFFHKEHFKIIRVSKEFYPSEKRKVLIMNKEF